MAISGMGAGICELTSLAVTSELAPTRKRGAYVAVLVLTIIPFCPSVLWAQLIAAHANWRYCCLFAGLWALMGLLGVLFFYHPPPRPAALGRTKKQILAEIDYVGGLLSISGMIVFLGKSSNATSFNVRANKRLAGLQWGGYQYPWKSAHVLVPLILGALLLFVAFPVWEIKFAKFPMFPSRMKQDARILVLTLIITAISGANFFSVSIAQVSVTSHI